MRIKQGDENMSHELHICWIAVNDLLAMVKKNEKWCCLKMVKTEILSGNHPNYESDVVIRLHSFICQLLWIKPYSQDMENRW